MTMQVLDLFSAAAGGWSLGLHRAGFETVAACEFVPWRRALYLQNNPGVRMYDDVSTLTGAELLRNLGFLPGIVVGSPPCQDISSANAKGKGVEGDRSGLYFEAIRIIGEIRDLGRERGESAARWFALENSANLRTRGADAVLAALEAVGYTCWAFVVGAGDIGANHERARSWLIGCDLSQVANSHHQPIRGAEQPGPESARRNLSSARASVGDFGGQNGSGPVPGGHGGVGDAADANGFGRDDGRQGRRSRLDFSIPQDSGHPSQDGRGSRVSRGRTGAVAGAEQSTRGDAAIGPGHVCAHGIRWPWSCSECDASDAQEAGWRHASVDAVRCQTEKPGDGCGNGCGVEGQSSGQVGLRSRDCGDVVGRRTDWSLDDLAHHLRVDDGLSTWVAQSRIAVGGPRGTSAASLIVEAFGDAVVPQIPEAIGRAILRTEQALAAVYGRSTAA